MPIRVTAISLQALKNTGNKILCMDKQYRLCWVYGCRGVVYKRGTKERIRNGQSKGLYEHIHKRDLDGQYIRKFEKFVNPASFNHLVDDDTGGGDTFDNLIPFLHHHYFPRLMWA